MPELVTDCPRCGSSKITFDVEAAKNIDKRYGWQNWYEVFCICRQCNTGTIFVLSENSIDDAKYVREVGILKIPRTLNQLLEIQGYISIKNIYNVGPPEHIPEEIEAIFKEGTMCMAVECYNAAGTMFRLCVDMATRGMLPNEEVKSLNAKVRRDLGLRLPWLFENNVLPESLKDLSTCIKEDGNDGAHAGTLKKLDAEDLLDFTLALLERIYTEPERLRLAKERRDSRRRTG
ncbi:MAG: DUF4145 domain-containing protein [Bellilinea sp.]